MGVPAILAREHVYELIRLTGDAGGGTWLRSRPSEVTSVPLDAAAVDIDTPSAVARLASISLARG
jgi:CTP:molybdopterin cytidylyltransferase MocA